MELLEDTHPMMVGSPQRNNLKLVNVTYEGNAFSCQYNDKGGSDKPLHSRHPVESIGLENGKRQENPRARAQEGSVPLNDDCNFVTDDLRSLTGHLKQKLLLCGICKKIFRSKCRLKEHLNTEHGGVLMCEWCAESFDNKPLLFEHIKSEHPDKVNFTCDLCQDIFARRSVYVSHMNMHFNFKPHKCLKCDKAFSDISDRRQHEGSCIVPGVVEKATKQKEKSNVARNIHSCNACGKKYMGKAAINRHQRKCGVKKGKQRKV